MNKIRREVDKLYMQLELGTMFDAYHDMMYEMCAEFDYLEDEELEEAQRILEDCQAIIKAQNILIARKIN